MRTTGKMELGGKQYTTSWGMNQSIEYCELRDISITEMNKDLAKLANDSGAVLRDLIWSSLKDGARKDKVEFELTNFDIGDLLEDIKPSEIENFIAGMVATLPKGKTKDIKKKIAASQS